MNAKSYISRIISETVMIETVSHKVTKRYQALVDMLLVDMLRVKGMNQALSPCFYDSQVAEIIRKMY